MELRSPERRIQPRVKTELSNSWDTGPGLWSSVPCLFPYNPQVLQVVNV